jgi:membrane carboxypeptidase/penicillin-binding protein
MKPIVYLAAFRQGALDLDTPVPDEPISVATSGEQRLKWFSNFDGEFKGIIPARQALAESRNAVAIWIVQQIGIDPVLRTARDVGIESLLHRYDTTALGASEVTLLELANAYRMMASGVYTEPYVIAKIEHGRGEIIYSHPAPCCESHENELGLSLIQEGLRGVVRPETIRSTSTAGARSIRSETPARFSTKRPALPSPAAVASTSRDAGISLVDPASEPRSAESTESLPAHDGSRSTGGHPCGAWVAWGARVRFSSTALRSATDRIAPFVLLRRC